MVSVAAQTPSIGQRQNLYAGHLLLLNDHWDSMRIDGFPSNRLFDGSAVGTPVRTDPVAGLSEVFGDAIATASGPEEFAGLARDCMTAPVPSCWRATASSIAPKRLPGGWRSRAGALQHDVERRLRSRLHAPAAVTPGR